MSRKAKTGLGNIGVRGERLLVIDDNLGWDKVRGLAVRHKVKAFGMVSNFLFKPNEEDIEIVYEEKRYEAFWHIVGVSRLEYKRKVNYRVPVEPVVMGVDFADGNRKVSKVDGTFEISGVEHCLENYREEVMVDAHTDEQKEYTRYLKYHSKVITGTDELTFDGTMAVNLETKASFLVRKVINSLVKPIKADEILDEKIAIEELSLYFFPVYTFEYHWKSKDKKVLVEFDGVTGEVRKGRKLTDKLRNSFTSEEMFDFAKEAANFFPGVGLAMMAGRKAYQMAKKQ